MNYLLTLLVVGGIFMLWLDGARAREIATTLAKRYCQNRGLQFLDGTVSQARMGIRWTKDGLRIRRMFGFDFSVGGLGRRTGYILMLGTRLEAIDDGLPKPSDQATQDNTEPDTIKTPDDDRKVVPFRKKDS